MSVTYANASKLQMTLLRSDDTRWQNQDYRFIHLCVIIYFTFQTYKWKSKKVKIIKMYKGRKRIKLSLKDALIRTHVQVQNQQKNK